MLAIRGGRLKGRRIKFAYIKKPRPSTGLLKDALFNILDKRLFGAHFMDCFAGSGAVGLEALSRGASFCAFIEIDGKLVQSLKQNLARFALNGSVHRQTFFSVFWYYTQKQVKFDFIYIDPPYFSRSFIQVIKALLKAKILKDDGIVILERHVKDHLFVERSLSELGLRRSDLRRYGMAELDFFVNS